MHDIFKENIFERETFLFHSYRLLEMPRRTPYEMEHTLHSVSASIYASKGKSSKFSLSYLERIMARLNKEPSQELGVAEVSLSTSLITSTCLTLLDSSKIIFKILIEIYVNVSRI